MKVSDGHRSRAQQRTASPGIVSPTSADLATTIRARLLAQETVMNGGHVNQAARTILGRASQKTKSIRNLLGTAKGTAAFADELESMLADANIDKEHALRTLWSMVNVSLVDFLDDEGNVMAVKDLKALPREAQQIISEMVVTRAYKPVRGEDGEYIYDPNTHQPMLRPEVSVKLKLPEKIKAIQTIASILKWIETKTSVTINIAQVMKAADERQKTVTAAYPAIEQAPDEA